MPDQATVTECPPLHELEKLIHGRCTEAQNAALCEHVGTCLECQRRLETLTGSAAEWAQRLREAEQEKPPHDSAYWRALAQAEQELLNTALFPANGFNAQVNILNIHHNIPLDFLQPTDQIGKLGRLGAFDIIRVVGRGGMGVVLHAYDPALDRDVALKVIDPQLANNEVARQRFCREARAAAAVTHDNLVAVHQVSEDELSGLPYLVMQLVVGESLEQRLKRVGKLTPAEVARIGMQAAAGLAAAHANGLIHRDIKPANILLESPADRVKLTDFGLARAAEDVKLTRTGFVAGSPLYMAPEQARGEEVDPRADLFSLGSVLYEAATGIAPFEAKSPLAVLRRVSDETQMPLKRINKDVPGWLSDAIDRLLAKNPADRFQSAAEVAEVLAAGLAEMHALSPLDVPAEVCAGARSTTHIRKSICWKTMGSRVLPWAAGAAGGALAVGLLWLLLGGSTAPPSQPEPPVIVQQLSPIAVRDTPTTVTLAALDVASGVVGPSVSPGPMPKLVLPGESGAVWTIAFLPGDRLVVGMEDGSVKVWNLQTAEIRRTLEPRLDGTIWTADVSPDGKYIVVTCDDANVPFWNATTYRSEGVSFPHQKYAKCAVFSPAGDLLAIGDRNSMVRVWNWEHHIPVELPGHRGTVHSLAFSSDGTRLASAGNDGKVKLWNLQEIDWLRREGPKQSLDLAEHKGPVYGVAISPDGKTVASAGWDGTVRIWDAEIGAQRRPIKAHDGDVWSVSFGNNGQWVASAGSDGWVRVWNVDTGTEVFAYRGTRPVHVVRFAPNGTTLAAAGRDGTVRVWDVNK